MKRVSDLAGAELDYWVAKAERMDGENGWGLAWVGTGNPDKPGNPRCNVAHKNWQGSKVWAPSSRWSQGGPILEREEISLKKGGAGHPWAAAITKEGAFVLYGYGDTPLIAAMRAYVTSRLGGTIPLNALEAGQ